MRILGVILAGGQGRRFGGVDKAMLILGGQRLLDSAADRLSPQVEDLCISANGDAARFCAPWPVVPDARPLGSLGPLSGILAAMIWAADQGGEYIASVAVDTPHFPCDLVARLRLAMDSTPSAALALARGTRVHGTFGLWSAAIRDDLAAFLASGANPRVLDFAARHCVAYADFAEDGAFDNINTAEDLARIAQTLQDQTVRGQS